MKIRTYLLLFALAILLPMIAFSAIAVVAFDRQQRVVVERGGVETARALMNAVDRELAGSISTLRTLATARSLERDDLATFYEDAHRVLAGQRSWMTITLFGPSGRRLLDLGQPLGTPLADIVERDSFVTVVRTSQPAVGRIVSGPLGRPAFAVRVPVVRKGTVVYVLTGVLEPAAIGQILTTQQFPADWVGTVFDSTRTVVARTRGTEQFVGRSISPEFIQLLDTGREGWAITHTLEGAPLYTAFSRSATTDWGVGVGIPPAAIEAPLRRSLWAVAGGGVAFVLAAVALSFLVGWRIARPIVALSATAEALGRQAETPLPVPRGGPEEVDAVARAFGEAIASAQAARADAEAANRAKDEFLAVLSHELRTPLNAVYGWARILKTAALDSSKTERAVDAIERNAAAQVRLIEDLLDISRIVTGKMRLEPQRVDLPAVVESALDSVRPAADAKGIQLETAVDRQAAIMGDPDRLQQVIWNLLSNAIKFTPSRGRVNLRVKRVDALVEIAVADTGVGIAPTVLPYVFDRFRQADSTSTRAHGGLGLGLALVRHLVELHGGAVTAASAGEGQGATFVVTLPSSS